jgi:Relaxase/Mobilisation nuclease domain
MIIKLHKAGRSFKGVCHYLTHDVKAETAERVAWTSTINLANDDVPLAVNEMLWTFRTADALKREAGVATGGSKLEKPVKHFSLSWPQGEAPTQEHMIETANAYMKHMGWSDRQAVLIAHNDRKHAHVHVVMNTVSPVDGRAVRSSNDWRHSEAFALRYEREQGQIHCEQRLKPTEERHATPTRESWQRFKSRRLRLTGRSSTG